MSVCMYTDRLLYAHASPPRPTRDLGGVCLEEAGGSAATACAAITAFFLGGGVSEN